jgi:hypothetical protein
MMENRASRYQVGRNGIVLIAPGYSFKPRSGRAMSLSVTIR